MKLWVLSLFLLLSSMQVRAEAPSRYEVMKTLKWRVIDVLEKNLSDQTLTSRDRELFEYTLLRIKSSLGQWTDKSYFEELYNQTYLLINIKNNLAHQDQRERIDDLVTFYQKLLNDLYKNS